MPLRQIRADFDADTIAARVHVQWDPERTLRGAALNHYSIQVGIGRTLIRTFAEDWVAGLTDLTPTVHPERPYPLRPELARPVLADG